MEEYTHYGKQIIVDYYSIVDELLCGKEYVILPISVKGALIVRVGEIYMVIDLRGDRYMTMDALPEDGNIELLMDDIYGQIQGNEPMKMPSLLKKLYDDAFWEADRLVRGNVLNKENLELFDRFRKSARNELTVGNASNEVVDTYLGSEASDDDWRTQIENEAKFRLVMKITADHLKAQGWYFENLEKLSAVCDDVSTIEMDNLRNGYDYYRI